MSYTHQKGVALLGPLLGLRNRSQCAKGYCQMVGLKDVTGRELMLPWNVLTRSLSLPYIKTTRLVSEYYLAN